MATQVRPNGEGKKIAFSILGVPENMLYKKTAKQKDRDLQIIWRESGSYKKSY
jgi:hypothetical protein